MSSSFLSKCPCIYKAGFQFFNNAGKPRIGYRESDVPGKSSAELIVVSNFSRNLFSSGLLERFHYFSTSLWRKVGTTQDAFTPGALKWISWEEHC